VRRPGSLYHFSFLQAPSAQPARDEARDRGFVSLEGLAALALVTPLLVAIAFLPSFVHNRHLTRTTAVELARLSAARTADALQQEDSLLSVGGTGQFTWGQKRTAIENYLDGVVRDIERGNGLPPGELSWRMRWHDAGFLGSSGPGWVEAKVWRLSREETESTARWYREWITPYCPPDHKCDI